MVGRFSDGRSRSSGLRQKSGVGWQGSPVSLRRSVDCCDGPGIQRSGFPGRSRGDILGRSSGTASEPDFRKAVSRLKGGRGPAKGGGRGVGPKSGDMTTRRTGRPACRAEGIAIRGHGRRGGIWPLPRGHDAEFAFCRALREKTRTLGIVRGPTGGGRGCRMKVRAPARTPPLLSLSWAREKKEPENQCRGSRAKHAARWTPARFWALRWPKATPMSYAVGVTLAWLWHVPERACGEPVEARGSRAMRDTMEAATRRTRRGCDAGAAVLGGKGERNEHAATRRSARGAELGSVSSVT